MTDEEFRQTINEVREMKQMCGNINMKLTNIVTQRGQDFKKKLEAEYQRGLDDAWEAARKIVCDDELDWNTLLHLFNRSNFEGIFGDFSPSEAIDKLKAYEEKQKAENEINVGDEVDWSGDKFIVTRIFQPYDKAEECDGVDMDGCTYHDVLISGLTKTGRHVDITDMLKGALE